MGKMLMDLKILLPSRIFSETKDVTDIIIETSEGSYGLLPQRVDCVAALVPGILTYKRGAGAVHYLAVDGGILVKAGLQVWVSVRNAVGGADLGKLSEMVKKEFKSLDENERKARSAMLKLESGFIHSFDKFRNG